MRSPALARRRPPTILADENIPFARETFGTLGEVRLTHGRRIARADLADVNLLIMRAITRVDAPLVDGTRVRFVGTATSGSDHVDVAGLERLGVAFQAALDEQDPLAVLLHHLPIGSIGGVRVDVTPVV